MNDSLAPDQLAALRDYAAGRLGTCQAIERTGLRDDAELIIALAQRDLACPGWPRRRAGKRIWRGRAPSSNCGLRNGD